MRIRPLSAHKVIFTLCSNFLCLLLIDLGVTCFYLSPRDGNPVPVADVTGPGLHWRIFETICFFFITPEIEPVIENLVGISPEM